MGCSGSRWSAQLVAPKTPNKFGTPQLAVRGAWRWVVAADRCVGFSADGAIRRYKLGIGTSLLRTAARRAILMYSPFSTWRK